MLPHGDAVWAVAYDSSGRIAATGGYDRVVRLWDADTGLPFGRWLRHSDAIVAMAFSPKFEDRRFLVTGCADGSLRVWDVESGRMIGPPRWHNSPATAVVSPSGGQFWSAGPPSLLSGWTMPCSLQASRDLLLQTGVHTGMRLHENGLVLPLTLDEWRERKTRLGGPG